MSSYELSRQLDVHQDTYWYFQSKVRKAMESSSRDPLQGEVEADEFFVSSPKEGKVG